ncbi:hypothetical protein Nepgr_006043 [Nepenthes gracilis]|uniref:MENTAL domain-containing protein n=1 Tax=Nepenthes gracilis TaxID=150966 RepID=A0AAD3S4B7_NEPGR|nr:hypothetical protein Nepgr_006043 [Nepenthes gracilis]
MLKVQERVSILLCVWSKHRTLVLQLLSQSSSSCLSFRCPLVLSYFFTALSPYSSLRFLSLWKTIAKYTSSPGMGMVKGEKSKRIIRAVKTLFFLIALLISFLLFSAPVLLAAADAVLPSALLSAYLSSSFLSPRTQAAYLANYDFRYSLIDIPLISIVRSILIICVYSCCDGPRLSRGPHLWAASTCSLLSLVFVSLKASFVFGGNIGNLSTGGGLGEREGCVIGAEVVLFVCSCALAIGHVMVAYRTCCRERKRLLVYKIDIEAVSACKNAFPRYEKMVQEERKN